MKSSEDVCPLQMQRIGGLLGAQEWTSIKTLQISP